MSRKLQLQQGMVHTPIPCLHACSSCPSRYRKAVDALYKTVQRSSSAGFAASHRDVLYGRKACRCWSSRDADRVSLLSADALEEENVSITAARSVSSSWGEVVQSQTVLSPAAEPKQNRYRVGISSMPQSTRPADSYLVSLPELRAVVAAAVDSSQTPAAEAAIAAFTARVLSKQQAQQAAKHMHSSTSNGRGAANTNGTAVADSPVQPAAVSSLGETFASALSTDLRQGVTGDAADTAARIAAFGSNSLAVSATSSFWQLLLEAASDSTLMLLTAAGVLSLGLTAGTGKEAVDYIDGAAILASVAICANVTAVTNYQKESKFRQLNSLKENIPVRVIRGGSEVTVSCFDLVVGDVLLVESGDILPADGLLVQGGAIKVDESHLTGESDDVGKEPVVNSSSSNGSSAPVSLSSCICMSGSKVLEGFGRMLVLAVGPNSQQGMIQQLVMNGATTASATPPLALDSSSSEGHAGHPGSDLPMLREATPLTSRLEDLANAIGGVGLAAAAAVLAVNAGLYTAELVSEGASLLTADSLEAYLGFFITSMTLLVVAVPEGLPLAVTLALAFSVQRMLTDNNLVRNLSSCETMAAATSICSDKTGTLTENNMAVVKLFIGGATFNVRPSSNRNNALAAAAAATGGAAASLMSYGNRVNSTSSILETTDTAAAAGGSEQQQQQQAPGSSISGMTDNSSSIGPVQSGGFVCVDSSGECAAADVLTRVSLSWDDGDQLELGAASPATYEELYIMAMQQQEKQQRRRQQLAVAAAGGDDYDSLSGLADESMLLNWSALSDISSLSLSSTSSLLGGSGGAAGGGVVMADVVKQLLADSISLNSTASVRLAPQQQGAADEAPAAAAAVVPDGDSSMLSSSSAGRQLDRSGNRTECALLEFGGRLAGRLLPGAGSSQQQQQVLQVFPFSSSRKRMSTLVCDGPPVATPATGAAVQPARLYVKGAAELLLDRCRLQIGLNGVLLPLSSDHVTALKARCGRGGLRVLALAYRDVLLQPNKQSSNGSSSDWQLLSDDEDDESDLVLIGLLGLEDPVRSAVPGAIEDCQRAGIAVRMITGDNAATAAAIAASCGILPATLAADVERLAAERAAEGVSSSQHIQQLRQLLTELPKPPALMSRNVSNNSSSTSDSSAATGVSGGIMSLGSVLPHIWGRVGAADPAAGAALLSAISPHPALAVLEGPVFRALVLSPDDGSTDLDTFLALWPHLRVMARCTPADKYVLVQAVKALRARGDLRETIAVTGDGTNDAPALNAADVGFAMAAGTSIAKDASDILLLDNNFRSIVSAVKWGRNVYGCVTKFLQFQLTANVVALVTAAGGALALRSSPLSAVQMLWVNLIMDSLASLALATEAPTDSVLDEPPRSRDGSIITPTVAKSIIGQAVLQLSVMAALLGPLGVALVATGQPDVTGVVDVDHTCQYTLVFNSFVIMQLFNQVNSRKIHDEPNVLDGLQDQKLFLAILGLEAALQVGIVQAGGRAFSTVPLSPLQWLVCVGFGGLTLLVRQMLIAVPTEPPAPGGGGGRSGGGEAAAAGQASNKGPTAAAAAAAAVTRPLKSATSLVAAVSGGVQQAVTAAVLAGRQLGSSTAAAAANRRSRQLAPNREGGAASQKSSRLAQRQRRRQQQLLQQ